MLELMGVLTAAVLTCASIDQTCNAGSEPVLARASIEQQALVVPKPVAKPNRRDKAASNQKTDTEGKGNRPKGQVASAQHNQDRRVDRSRRVPLIIGNYY